MSCAGTFCLPVTNNGAVCCVSKKGSVVVLVSAGGNSPLMIGFKDAEMRVLWTMITTLMAARACALDLLN
jgi:hypothetical protein